MKTSKFKTTPALIVCVLLFVCDAYSQTPELVGWHTKKPFKTSFDSAFAKSVEAVEASTLENLQTHDGWLVTGSNHYLRAAISCVQVAEGVMINIQIAGAQDHETDALIMRDFLKNYILGTNPQAAPVRYGTSAAPVSQGPVVRTEKTSYRPAEPITVEFFNLPADRTDEWITIVPYDYEAGKYRKWRYTGKRTDGTLSFGGLTKGRYEVRYHYSNGDDQVRARHAFKVE